MKSKKPRRRYIKPDSQFAGYVKPKLLVDYIYFITCKRGTP